MQDRYSTFILSMFQKFQCLNFPEEFIVRDGRQRFSVLRKTYTDKKENEMFLIYQEIQKGSVGKSYMTNGLLVCG